MEAKTISREYTVFEAMQQFQINNDRVTLIEENGKIIGLVSEGDIIKALVSGIDIHSRIDRIMNRNFRYLHEKDLEKATKLFKKYKITMIPVLNESFELIETISLDDVFEYMEEK